MKSLGVCGDVVGQRDQVGCQRLEQTRLREVDHVRRAAALQQHGRLDLELVGALEVDLDTRAVDEWLPEVGEDLMASGSFSLLRTGDRTDTVLPAYC